MSEEQSLTMNVFINPLAFVDIDLPNDNDSSNTIDPQKIINYLCDPESSSDLPSLINRYREISAEPSALFIVPTEQQFWGKIILPLKSAKGSYMVGNYLGAIALCGMVAEMIAILIFEMSGQDIQIGNKHLDDDLQKKLFNSTFENLGQDRRISVLLGLGLISQDQKQKFDEIKNIRKKYLHFYSKEHTDITKDAIKVFGACEKLVVDLIGQNFVAGRLVLNAAFARYLIKIGFAKAPSQE